MDYLLLATSYAQYFWDSWYELKQYSTNLSQTQWGIIAASSVVFGFCCLKGNPIKQ